MKRLMKSLLFAATGVSLLCWAQTANAQQQQVPRRPHTFPVIISELGPNEYQVDPVTVDGLHRRDFVVWVFTFETSWAEVHLCKNFEPNGKMQISRVGGSPAPKCTYSTDETPAILKAKIKASANSGEYFYTIAFVPTSVDTLVIIDPSLIVDDEG